ncbi:MAG: pyridoxamine kinase [Sporomusaceae bacterium]|nr:pyridoxamine kinase [Sporomusaceae bacterium]
MTQNSNIKKVAAIHDLSCIGRCSLTVIIPVLSAMGIQVCPLPTAILSSHFGGFSHIASCDFTEYISPFAASWQQEKVSFEAIYSGFLASEAQIDGVLAAIDRFAATNPLILVDPVMGDDGKLYSPYTKSMQEHMRRLVQQADVITPNYTEACFLLKEAYETPMSTPEKIHQWLIALSQFGPHKVVITGIPLAGGKLLNAGYDSVSGEFWQKVSERIPVSYPGTGDLFASLLLGQLLAQKSLSEAMDQAIQFVELAVKKTYEAQTPRREGVLLEKMLPYLLQESVEGQ